jgi:polysaccharide export outer membrane protein
MKIIALLLIVCTSTASAALANDSAPAPAPGGAAAKVAAAAVAAPPQPTGGYRLFPGDQLHIQVFDNPDLELDFRVADTGTMTFPLIGEVSGLIGRSLDDVDRELTRRLMEGYLRSAVVTITVRDYGRRTATVMGGVNHAGEVELDPLRGSTAMHAIGASGGFTDDADRAGAVVLRGGKQSLPVPKGDRPSDLAGDVALEPGDLIIVPRLDRIFILGQVGKPGALNLPSQDALTVSKAISLAGGFDKYAKKSEVQLIRGGHRASTVNVGKVLTGEHGADDPRLEPGDTVYVPESRW